MLRSSLIQDADLRLKELNSTLSHKPTHVIALFYRALLLDQLGKKQDALTDLTRAIEVNIENNFFDARFALAKLLFSLSKIHEAVQAAKKCLIEYKNKAPLSGLQSMHRLLNDAFLYMRDYDHATENLVEMEHSCAQDNYQLFLQAKTNKLIVFGEIEECSEFIQQVSMTNNLQLPNHINQTMRLISDYCSHLEMGIEKYTVLVPILDEYNASVENLNFANMEHVQEVSVYTSKTWDDLSCKTIYVSLCVAQ